jgi:hypothetical protein
MIEKIKHWFSGEKKPVGKKPRRPATNATDAIKNIVNALEGIDKQLDENPEFEKAVMEALANEGKHKKQTKAKSKTCPMCAENVKYAAKICLEFNS